MPTTHGETLSSARPRRIQQLTALLVTTAAIAAVLIAVLSSSSTSQLAPGKPVPRAHATLALLANIPQQGISLGSPTAPVTLVEFGDPQCPSCAIFARNVLPTIVSHFVRPGRVRLMFRSLDFLGQDSTRAARTAAALGQQNRLWQFIELMYANQGAENTGYVTDRYLRALVGAIPGVDVRRALSDRNSPAAQAEIDQATALAKQLHLRSTPSFLLSSAGRPPRVFTPAALDTDSFVGPLQRALAASNR